jgi:purine-nucleoside phosphorylase
MKENDYPLFWDTTNAPSAFDPSDWFAYCERITGRRRPVLPPLAIQTVIPSHFDLILDRHGVKPDDFTLAGHPFARFEIEGVAMVIGLSAKGSYAAGGLDELIALGARHIIVLGGSATLSRAVAVDDLFIPTKALRDEGVSLHYIPPSRYAYPSARLLQVLLAVSAKAEIPIKSGPVWTMNAHFRQSLPRLQAFRAEGCLAVNNEASPAFAVGQARGADVAALLNIGDTLEADRFAVPEGHAELYKRADSAFQLDLAIRALIEFHREMQ